MADYMSNMGCCKVEAIITLDSKGQIVLPKDIREKAGLKPNDKLAVVCCKEKGKDEVCCLIMVKAENLEEPVKKALEPILKEIFK
ncbi:MAG: HgcAB-associated protein HgcC [Candidatus Bathyarchaeales archaeon]